MPIFLHMFVSPARISYRKSPNIRHTIHSIWITSRHFVIDNKLWTIRQFIDFIDKMCIHRWERIRRISGFWFAHNSVSTSFPYKMWQAFFPDNSMYLTYSKNQVCTCRIFGKVIANANQFGWKCGDIRLILTRCVHLKWSDIVAHTKITILQSKSQSVQLISTNKFGRLFTFEFRIRSVFAILDDGTVWFL